MDRREETQKRAEELFTQLWHNTDATGFARSLTRGLPDVRMDDVVLLGAGGAGAAVAHALLSLGTRRLTSRFGTRRTCVPLARSANYEPGGGRRRASEMPRCPACHS